MLWSPQPGPQTSFLHCPIKDVLFGGARGGGKTDGTLGQQLHRQRWLGKLFNEVYFRQEMPQADDLIERAKELYLPLGAEWKEQQKQFAFPAGGRLRFRPLENTKDASKYQGQNLSGCTVEESGNYPSPDPIDRLWGAMRGGDYIQMRQTANPGGAGQGWLKERYIDPCPTGNKIIKCRLPNGAEHERIFIPSKVADNQILLRNDPDYVNRLYMVGSRELVKAWLDGDWNAIEGAYFSEWCGLHVVQPFEIPADWLRFRSMDWGSAKPFSVGWWAIASDPHKTPTVTIPRGAMVRYREWYGKKSANVGLKMDAEAVAKGVLAREAEGEKISYSVADPAMWAEDGGPSLEERFANEKVFLSRADNARVGRDGHMGGWDMMRTRLVGEEPVRGADGAVERVTQPMIFCFSTCADSIRTIPLLQHDEKRPEDLDTSAEDHAADEWRYACMSRPWIPAGKAGAKPRRDGYDRKESEGVDWRTI